MALEQSPQEPQMTALADPESVGDAEMARSPMTSKDGLTFADRPLLVLC